MGASIRCRSILWRLDEVNENVGLMLVLVLLLVVLLGYLGWRGLFRPRGREREDAAREKQRADGNAETIERLQASLEERDQQLGQLRSESAAAKEELAREKALRESEQKAAKEQIALLQEAEKRLGESFENLANRIFEDKSKKFTDQNKENLEGTLNPLREQLRDFRQKIEENQSSDIKARTELHAKITQLQELNQQISVDADNLTKALKGDSKKLGDWGEMVLERVLEQSGLEEGREYETQASRRDEEDDRNRRPDVIVHLPDSKDVIIDSKVSLNAYQRYSESEDPEEERRALAEHLVSIRRHIKDLRDKRYDQLIGVNSLHAVLMFVAIEPALLLAVKEEPGLFGEAQKSGIFLVGPSTLMLALQVISNIWRHEYQTINAQKIADRGGKLYDKFVGFVESLTRIGHSLKGAQKSYDEAYGQLERGRGNLVGQAEKLRKLGVSVRKRLPQDIGEEADASEKMEADAATGVPGLPDPGDGEPPESA